MLVPQRVHRFETEIDTVDGYEILHQAGELWKVPMKHCK